MPQTNVEIVRELLENATDREVVYRLVAPDAVYVSLTFDNPDLKKLMPWAGRHTNGPAGILDVFVTLNRHWTIDNFEIQQIFGENENVAVFGTFTVHSVRLDKIFVSPFAVLATVKNGLVTFMQYMEDTFGTGSTFRSSGAWKFQSDPNGAEVEV